MNHDPRSTSGFKTPFHLFYGREPNHGQIETGSGQHFHDVAKLQQGIAEIVEKNIEKSKKQYPAECERLQAGDKVLIRNAPKGKKCSFRRHVESGIVTKIGVQNMYLVESSTCKKWCSIENLRLLKRHTLKKFHQERYLIPRKSDDHDLFSGSGFQVRLNPVGDGNCQFAAISDQLRTVLGVEHSAQSLQKDIVKYLRRVRSQVAPFVEGNINDYLQEMAHQTTFGDHLTLQTISDNYSVDIQVVLPSGVTYCTLTPQNSFHPLGGLSA